MLLELPIFEDIHNRVSAEFVHAPGPIEIRLDQIFVENGKRKEYTVT
jgi:hypothetical protein